MTLQHNTLYNMDCMEGMRQFPDKYFELAIVDPPYGIDRGETFGGKNWKQYTKKTWDKSAPDSEYFQELFRVSQNQIIWGANYFAEFLPPSMGWVVWDKGQRLTMSDGELAFTSFQSALRIYEKNRCAIGEHGGNIHPTQKPVSLYKWLMSKYAKPGDKILDTHVGSASSLIACLDMGHEFVGFELDSEYHAAAQKRIREFLSQPKLPFVA